jgi:hypothetical protein
LLCFATAIFFNISCVPTSSDPLEYRIFPFTAEVSVYYVENEFDAVFFFSPPSEGQSRDFSVRFISPKSLEGLNLSRSGDELKILLENTEYIALPSRVFSNLRINSVADMLSPTASIRSILSIRGAECGLPAFTSLTAVTAGDTVIYIDPESSLPVKIANIKSGEYLIINKISVEKQ